MPINCIGCYKSLTPLLPSRQILLSPLYDTQKRICKLQLFVWSEPVRFNSLVNGSDLSTIPPSTFLSCTVLVTTACVRAEVNSASHSAEAGRDYWYIIKLQRRRRSLQNDISSSSRFGWYQNSLVVSRGKICLTICGFNFCCYSDLKLTTS